MLGQLEMGRDMSTQPRSGLQRQWKTKSSSFRLIFFFLNCVGLTFGAVQKTTIAVGVFGAQVYNFVFLKNLRFDEKLGLNISDPVDLGPSGMFFSVLFF